MIRPERVVENVRDVLRAWAREGSLLEHWQSYSRTCFDHEFVKWVDDILHASDKMADA
jgi:hypothetical protein